MEGMHMFVESKVNLYYKNSLGEAVPSLLPSPADY